MVLTIGEGRLSASVSPFASKEGSLLCAWSQRCWSEGIQIPILHTGFVERMSLEFLRSDGRAEQDRAALETRSERRKKEMRGGIDVTGARGS
jgi:hypothetical protein